ncbi:MAG: cation:proton antiporter, partial [Aurantibacter sp.]
METGINYLPIFLVMFIAWVVPVVMANVRIIKIPPVIVEIILGFVIGKNVLDILPEAQYMDFLALTGFLFLLFMSGLEIDVDQIRASLPRRGFKLKQVIGNPLLLSLIIYFGSLVFAFLAATGLAQLAEIQDISFLAVVIPTVALSIVAPVLKEQGDIGKKHGQVIMLVGAVSTIMSIILISFYSGLLQNGISAELLLFLVIFFTFFVSIYAGRFLMKVPLFQKLLYQLEHAASQIKVRGTIALILGFVTIAYLIRVELVLGAFLTGILLSIFLAKERSALIIKLDGMSYGFFVPIFFIMVGANLDLSALDQFDNSYLFLAVLLVAVFAVQVLPSLLMIREFGTRTSLSAGVLLTSRLGLTIASAQIGMQLGVISPGVNAAIVIVSIISSLLAPILYHQLHPASVFTAEKTLIIGGSRIGLYLAERLRLHGKEVVIVEVDKTKFHQLEQQGLRVVLGSGMDPKLYQQLN